MKRHAETRNPASSRASTGAAGASGASAIAPDHEPEALDAVAKSGQWMSLGREVEDEAPDGFGHRRSGRSGAKCCLEEFHPLDAAVEEQLLLAREVVEDGDLGDAGSYGDLRDGHLVEPALDEQRCGDVRDALPGLAFLAFAEAAVQVTSVAHRNSILGSNMS
jgi:hypothetical protein